MHKEAGPGLSEGQVCKHCPSLIEVNSRSGRCFHASTMKASTMQASDGAYPEREPSPAGRYVLARSRRYVLDAMHIYQSNP